MTGRHNGWNWGGILTFLMGFGLVFACPSLWAQNGLRSHLVLVPAQLRADAAVLEQSLRFAQPILDKEFNSAWMDKRFRRFNAGLSDSLTYLGFLKEVALLLTETESFSVSWGHSKDYVTFRNAQIPVFPLRFEICDGRFFLTEALNGESWEKGVEVLSIDGVSCTKYLKENYALLPIEGTNTFIQDRWLEDYFPNHHSNFWSQQDSFMVEWLDGNGQKRKRKVAAVLRNDLQSPQYSRKPFISHDRVTDIPILDLSDYHLYRNPLPDWRVDSLFGNLHSTPVFVLDLTGYSDLDLQMASFLLSRLYPEAGFFYDRLEDFSMDGKGGWRLWKPDSLAAPPVPYPLPFTFQWFPGRLVVVVDGETHSFKRLLAAHLRSRPNTVLVGELPNGNSYSVLADYEMRTLPHSGIVISIPKVRMSVKTGAMTGDRQLGLDKEFVRRPGITMQRLVLDWLERGEK